MTIWLITLINLFPAAWGKSSDVPDPMDKPTVWSEGFTRSVANVFKSNNYLISDRETKDQELRRLGHIPPGERDDIFRKVGIEDKLSDLDELDKDLLVIGVRRHSVPELRKKYPMLSAPQLRHLKREVSHFK